MLFGVTVRANKFEIFQIIMISVAIFVMNCKYFDFVVITPLALSTAGLHNSDFETASKFNFVLSGFASVATTGTIFIRAPTATCFQTNATFYQLTAYDAFDYLPASLTITCRATIYCAIRNLVWTAVNRFFADNTAYIRSPYE